MSKYNVKLDFWEFVYDVEAENEQEAIKNALIKLTNNSEDFFTAPDEIANTILDNFENSSSADEVEDDQRIRETVFC